MPNYLHQASGVAGGGFPWSFRMYSSSTATEANAESFWAGGIVAMFDSSGFNGLLSSQIELTDTYTSTMNASWKQTTKTSTTHAISGVATQSLPYQVAEVVTLRTNLATKYGHGRWFLPPMAVDALATDGLLLSTTAVNDIVTAVNAAFSEWSGVLTPVILHRKGTLTGPGPLTTDPISSGDVSNKFVIQKRRADKLVPTRTALTL